MAHTVIDTPIGKLKIVAEDDTISSITFFTQKIENSPTKSDILDALSKELIEYFQGDRKTFSSYPLKVVGTPFQKKIWATLKKIPAGKTVTYGALAELAGYPNAARAVGSAMKNNPWCILIPCHRVVPSSGGVGDYAGKPERKKWLLKHEKKL